MVHHGMIFVPLGYQAIPESERGVGGKREAQNDICYNRSSPTHVPVKGDCVVDMFMVLVFKVEDFHVQ